MARVLMAWELGSGVGHVTTLLTIARGLRKHGHDVTFAIRFLAEPWPLLENEGFPVVQAPFWRSSPRSRTRPEHTYAYTFADMLTAHGFDVPQVLLPMAHAWDGILAMVRPDLIVADYAPGIGVVAFGRVPIVLTGNGYCVPPVHATEFPTLPSESGPPAPQASLLAAVQDVQRRRGCPVVERLPQVLDGVARFLPSYPEMDPYAGSRSDVAVGPLTVPPSTPLPAKPFCLAFLPGEHPRLDDLITGLGAARVPGLVYVRNAGAGIHAKIAAAGLECSASPIDLAAILPRVSVVVSHAGLGFATTMLAAGRPQVLCPMYGEQVTNALNVVRLGCGIRLGHNIPARHAGQALRQVLEEPRFAAAAQAWATLLRARFPEPSLPRVLDACNRALFTRHLSPPGLPC